MKKDSEKGNDESGKQTQSVGIIFKQERMYIGYGRLSNTMWKTARFTWNKRIQLRDDR